MRAASFTEKTLRGITYKSVWHVRGPSVTVPKTIHNVKRVSIMLSPGTFQHKSRIVLRSAAKNESVV